MEDYELKISQLIDNELPNEEEQEVFLFLAENEEGRRIFADFMNMKKETNSYYAGIAPELNEPKIIAANISDEKENKYKMLFYYSVAAAILLTIILTSNFIKENPFETRYENLQSEFVILQKDYSNVLNEKEKLSNMNNLYAEKLLNIGRESSSNRIVKKHKTPNKQKVEKSNSPKVNYSGRVLASVQDVQTIEITKNDFLGGQIIGN